jgi:OOP family OmpA-OmpF porin
MKKTRIAAALSLALACGAAQAQIGEPRGDARGWYGGIDLGQGRARVDGLNDSRDTSLGADAGYRFNRNFAVEGGYTRLGDFSPSYNARALSLSAIGLLPLEDRFSLYGKAGVARTRAETDSATDNANSLVFGAGVRYDITSQWFAKAGWDRYTKVGGADTGSGHADVLAVGVGLQFR